jgi:hypothetical protein
MKLLELKQIYLKNYYRRSKRIGQAKFCTKDGYMTIIKEGNIPIGNVYLHAKKDYIN